MRMFQDLNYQSELIVIHLICSASLNLKISPVEIKTKPDNFTFKVNWDNKDKILNQGNFIARGTLANNTTRKKYATLNVEIDSSHIYAGNDLWRVSNSSILIDSNAIKVNKLAITSNDRSYLVDGTVSQNPADTMNLEFHGIDIDPLNYWINRKKNSQNQIPLNFKGHLNGKILLTNVYKSLLLAGNIFIDSFSVLGSDFGRISINANLDNSNKIVNILASNNLNSVKMFDVSGKYDPATKKIDLTARATKLPVGFLNPLLKVFASDISGFATGKLKLSGETDNLVLHGSVMAENTSMKINYLQTKYILNDSIRFDKQGFKFNNVRLTDVDGNTATLFGSVYHKNFQNYTADLIINYK